MINITFLPSEKVIQIPIGTSILHAASSAGVQVVSTCGGKGTCGKCKVQILTETPSQITETEKKFVSASELASGWVLACQHLLTQDMIVRLQEQNDVYKRKTDFAGVLQLNVAPRVQKLPLKLSKPSVEDQTPDWDRLMAALPVAGIQFNRTVAASLPKVFRLGDFQVTAVLDGDRLLVVEPGDTTGRCFGVAIDVGTTTVVAYLMDLNKGTVINSGAMTNPQQAYGADVISRITHASSGPDQLRALQEKVIGGLNNIIRLCQEHGISREEIYQAVVVGNTTMAHLFLGIDPTYLAPAPFIPVYRESVEVRANELGLDILGTGTVVMLPNVAGYVGSDTVGVMLAAEADRLPGVSLIVDIGTNGEIILCGKDRILTCSTAAGPAFEGAEIKYGMRAAEGAIEGVRITEDVELDVIAGSTARGICGSGLIDAIAELFKVGVIGPTGRFASGPAHLEKLPTLVRERLRKTERASEFVLVWGKDSASGEDIVLSQKDIREMQLAKGAIMAGIMILVREMGVTPHEIDRVLLAGAFGNYIRKESAIGIGLLPFLPLEKITTIGNAAGDGAKMALLSTEERARADSLAKRAEHVELSTKKEFQAEFIKGLDFKRVD